MRNRLNIPALIVLISAFIFPSEAAETDVTKIVQFPPGNYLCSLLIQGKDQKLNFEVKGEELVCVNATEKGMIGLRGKHQLLGGNGVFQVQLRGGAFAATQFWVFNKDGSITIKEIPDRGEKQRAVTVNGKTLDP